MASWWPSSWHRSTPTVATSAVSPAPSSPGWSELPPIQRMVTATPPIASLERFTGSLATSRNPSFLSSLGHSVDRHGPGGFVEGLLSPGLPQPSASGGELALREKPVEPTLIQRLVLPVSPEPVQRLIPNSAAQFSADLTHAPAPDPERVLPVVDQPVATEPNSGEGDVLATDAPLIGTSEPSGPSIPETLHEPTHPTPTVDLLLATPAPTVSRLVSGRAAGAGLAAPLNDPAVQTGQSTSPAQTAPTLGLSALLPTSPPSTPPSTPFSSSASAPEIPRRGLGAPLPTTPLQRHIDTTPEPAALLGLEHVLRPSFSDPTMSKRPDPGASLPLAPSIQRSADTMSSTEHIPTIMQADHQELAHHNGQAHHGENADHDEQADHDETAEHSEHSEHVETRVAEPDAPLVGGSVLSETPVSDDVAVRTSNSAAELPLALGYAPSPAVAAPVPLQRYVGESAGVPEPQMIKRLVTRPLIGDRPPLASVTSSSGAGPVQRTAVDVDPVVAVRYGAPSPGNAGTTTPATPRLQRVAARDSGVTEQSVMHRAAIYSQGASLQRFADSVAAVGSSDARNLPNGPDQPATAQHSANPPGPPSAALLLQRFGNPGQAAVAAGVATLDGQGSVVFNSPYQPSVAPSHAPEVQRAVELNEISAAVSAPAGAPAAPATPDIDELAQRLFDPLSARLKTELWMDRERAGFVTDLRR